MNSKHVPPGCRLSSFHCVFCGVYSQHSWFELYQHAHGRVDSTDAVSALCQHCLKTSYWVFEKLVYPPSTPAEPMHPDLPELCRPEYEEASAVFTQSPRASAALIRLAIQKLMAEVGEPGKDINCDIKSLVKKGLPRMIQQSLDICRVVGNNAVHPGKMDLKDTPEIAASLFRLLNIIVEELISKPREIENIYNALPSGARNAIENRDGS